MASRFLRSAVVGFTCALVACGLLEEDPKSSSTKSEVTAGEPVTCVTVQRGTAGIVEDAYVKANAHAKNFGGQPVIRVSAKEEALLRFDLASIPPAAALTSATLKLYVNGENGDGSIDVHRVLGPWSEATVTYASFAQRFAPQIAGAFRVESRTAQKSVDLKGLVKSWLSGAQPNFGVLLKPGADHHASCRHDDDDDQDPTLFVSSDAVHGARRPALEVCYTLPTANHCAPNPCSNGGSCTNTSGGFTCLCVPGYTGNQCQTNIDDCATNPCQNGGVCSDAVGTFACACPTGFSGVTCEMNIDDCAPNPCQNGGVCTDGVASHTCSCPLGYDGASCENRIDNCASQPCHNSGTCTNATGGYTCSCAPGFTGASCDTNVDDCVDNACANGTCVDGFNAYSCSCAPDWGGTRCDVNLNSCGQQPCLNGATCVNAPGSYSCQCAPGYTGTNCEVDVNDCSPSSCQNGGVCVDGVNRFTCTCPEGFSGASCETPVAKTLVLTGMVRDFHTHGSFGESVMQWLGTRHAPRSFNRNIPYQQLWNDVPGVNVGHPLSLTLTNAGQADPNVFSYESNAFFPIDGDLFGNEGSAHNEFFTYELHTSIAVTPGTTLQFDSADGLVVFLNGKAVAATPNARVLTPVAPGTLTATTVNLDATGLPLGGIYPLDIFFLRSTTPSAARLKLQVTQPACTFKTASSFTRILPGATTPMGAATANADGTVTLVPSTPDVAGAVWRTVPLAWEGFRTEFDVELVGPASGGNVEGYALVLAGALGVGASGDSLGYVGLGPSLAIEFDTTLNTRLFDPIRNHISVHTRGAQPNSAFENLAIAVSPVDPARLLSLDTPTPYHVAVELEHVPGQPKAWIRAYWAYDTYGQFTAISEAQQDVPFLAAEVDWQLLVDSVGTGDVYVGLTAGTGSPSSKPPYSIVIRNWIVAERNESAATTSAIASAAPVVVPASGSLVVRARDRFGGVRTSGGAAACFDAALRLNDARVAAPVSDNLDGTYTVGFTPSAPGLWSAGVKLRGADISGSPYPVQVTGP